MSADHRFYQYMDYLSGPLGHLDRRAGLRDYCTGLMLPLSRNCARCWRQYRKGRLNALQWLLIEWPKGDDEPCKYDLSTLPENIELSELVGATYQRWRIERDYQVLKQEFGPGHDECRGWRGFHHHATLSIAPTAL